MKINKLTLFCAFFFLSRLAFGVNGEEFDISKIPLNQCTFEKAVSTLGVMSITRASKIAENSIDTLNEIRNIVDYAKKPRKPDARIGDFLSRGELDKFSEANQRLGALYKAILIEGDFERDVTVVSRLVRLAGHYYRDNKIPSENNKDDVLLFGFLALGYRELPFDDLMPVKPDQMEKCNLDYALFNLEANSLNKAMELRQGWDMANARVDKIYAKYPTSDKKFEILSEADKNEVSFLANKQIFPLQREMYLIRSIELIRHYAKISQLRYASSMSDLLYSGGDIRKTNVTMNKKITNGELGKADVFVFKTWNLINDKIPSRTFKEFKTMNDYFSKKRKKR